MSTLQNILTGHDPKLLDITVDELTANSINADTLNVDNLTVTNLNVLNDLTVGNEITSGGPISSDDVFYASSNDTIPTFSFKIHPTLGMECNVNGDEVSIIGPNSNVLHLNATDTILSKKLSIYSGGPYDSSIDQILQTRIAGVPWFNSGNGQNLTSTSTFKYTRVGNICTLTITGIASDVLTANGHLLSGLVVAPEFRPISDLWDVAFPILKSRTADLPDFAPTAFLVYTWADNTWRIKNTSNNGDFPNGQDVIFNAISICYDCVL